MYGKNTREPSGGHLNNPIPGMGRLGVGTHSVVVLAVSQGVRRTTAIFETVGTRHIHSEDFIWLPPWVASGLVLKVSVSLTPGFIVCRDVDRYQAQRADTLEPLTEWLPELMEVYALAAQSGLNPATTTITELNSDKHGIYKPKTHAAEASQPASKPNDSTAENLKA